MKPFDEAQKFLSRKLVGKTILIPGLRKPRTVHKASLKSDEYGEPVVVVYFEDSHYVLSQGDELEIVGE